MWPVSTLELGGPVRLGKVWLTVTENAQALHSACVWDKTLEICQIFQIYKWSMSNDCFKHSVGYFFTCQSGQCHLKLEKKEETLLTSTFCLSPWIPTGYIYFLLWSQLLMSDTPHKHRPPVAKLGNPWQCSVELFPTLEENRVSSVRNSWQVI